jgi:hypothetical protein
VAKNTKAQSDPYFKMITKDGVLVLQRGQGDLGAWADRRPHYDGVEFAEYSLRIDCRQKGVRLLSWKRDGQNVIATVAWL